jgi:hypothetical protein
VVSIYILIPFIIIPQLLFSGVLVKFDNLHRNENTVNEYVPVLGELMPARWAYEALAVEQFKSNRYEANFFRYDMEISQNDWYVRFLIQALQRDLMECRYYNDSSQYDLIVSDNFGKLTSYIKNLSALAGFDPPPAELVSSLNKERFNPETAETTESLLDSLAGHFKTVSNINKSKKDSVTIALVAKMGMEAFLELKDDYTNKRLREIMLDEFNTQKSIETRGKIIQKYEPVFMKPVAKNGRAHFYAPYKMIGNTAIDTLWFNIMVLWLVSLILYIALYFKLLKKAVGT